MISAETTTTKFSFRSNYSISEILSLTGLRFFAAFAILIHHLLLGFISRDAQNLSTVLGNCGVLGMNIFFVLSGFIIHYTYYNKISGTAGVYGFFVARFARLYPLYITLFLFELFLSRVILHEVQVRDVWASLPYLLTMTQSWAYQLSPNGALIAYVFPRSSISWSISTEMLMYAAYPLLLAGFARDRLPHWLRLTVCCVLVAALSLGMRWLWNNIADVDQIGVSLFGPQAALSRNVSYSFAFWLLFISPYMRVFEFIIGALTAQAFLRLQGVPVGKAEMVGMSLVGAACVAAILWGLSPSGQMLATMIGYCPFIALVIFCCARYQTGPVAIFFSARPFVWLGERSYSLYLFHIFVYGYALYLLKSIDQPWLKISLTWIALLISVYALYRFIEMPGRKWLRQRLMKRPSFLPGDRGAPLR